MARDQLTFNLGLLNHQQQFFPRIDSKGLALFAVDMGVLSLIALNFPYTAVQSPRGVAAAFAAFLACWSLVHVAWVYFPRLSGAGRASLLYFGDVASMDEDLYVATLAAASDETLIRDAAHQVWRNAEILRMKYRHLDVATKLLAAAVIPWLGFLIAIAVGGGTISLGK